MEKQRCYWVWSDWALQWYSRCLCPSTAHATSLLKCTTSIVISNMHTTLKTDIVSTCHLKAFSSGSLFHWVSMKQCQIWFQHSMALCMHVLACSWLSSTKNMPANEHISNRDDSFYYFSPISFCGPTILKNAKFSCQCLIINLSVCYHS